MTVFLATGDLHLEAGLDYSADRLSDQEQLLDQLAAHARDHQVDAVLIAGDVFHRPRPTPAALMVFRRFAEQLRDAGIPAIAISGNAGHDIENGDRPCALELFRSGWVRVSRTPEVIKAPGDVAVCTLPSVPVHRLAAMFDGAARDEINEHAAQLLVDTARDLRAQTPDGWPAILLGHWSVSGAALPSGLPVADLREPVLPLEELERLGFDACVFGHIHRPQLLSDAAFVAYTGSPQVVNFGESLVDHGAWLLEVEGTDANATFLPVTDRRFVTVDVDLTAGAHDELGLDETDALAAAIATHLPLDDAVVRIRYRATDEQHRRVNQQALKAVCLDGGAHRVWQIAPDIVRASRARVDGVDETLEPLAAADAWMLAHGLDEPRRSGLHTLIGRYIQTAVTP